jgi:methylglutaconyl-CoA hydratase
MTPATMRRLFITGERFDSTAAQKIGLIDIIVTPEKLDETINSCVEQIRSSGPTAIKEIKHLIYHLQKMDIKEYKEFAVEKISELRVSKEGQEGIKGFLEKRKPSWRK